MPEVVVPVEQHDIFSPSALRWYATEQPMMPPPMMTIRAAAGGLPEELRVSSLKSDSLAPCRDSDPVDGARSARGTDQSGYANGVWVADSYALFRCHALGRVNVSMP